MTKDFNYMKYIEHNYEELFDIKHDPHETMNLANDSKYKKKLSWLRNRFKKLKKRPNKFCIVARVNLPGLKFNEPNRSIERTDVNYLQCNS